MEQHVANDDSLELAAALATCVAAQQGVLERHLEADAKRLKPKAAHELRVAARRLLSALALSRSLGLQPEQSTFRRLRRLLSRLSPARDAHVQLGLLAELLPRHPGSPALLAELRKQRRAASRRASKRLRAFARSKHVRELSVVRAALQTTTAAPPLAATALRGQLAERHLAVDRQMHGVSADDPEALHALRVALKDYRYALEALAPALPGAAETARRCESLQNVLGAAHDTHVLAQSARRLADQQGSAALSDLSEALTERSRAAHLEAAAALARARLPWPVAASANRE